MNRINILYLDHSNDFSGGQISLIALLRLLDKEKFNPIVVLDKEANILKSELKKYSIEYIEFPFNSIQYYRIDAFLKLAWKLKSIIKKKQIDIVFGNTFMTGFILAVLSPFLRRPFIFRARLAIEHHGHGTIDKLIYFRANLILANSKYVQKTFEDKFGANGRIITIYNPLILERSEMIEIPRQEFTFGIIGRIERIKRHLDIVEAVAILARKNLRVKVLIIGSPSKGDNGRYNHEVQEAIKVKNLEQYFEFTGFIENTMQLAHKINVCISCTIGEALSRSIFECQYYGTIILASDSGGNKELIEDGQTGYVFKPGDAGDLASKMELLIENQHSINMLNIRKQARSQSELFFNENQTVRLEETEYCKLLK